MTTVKKLIMAGALAISSIIPVGMAEAGPMSAPTINVEHQSDVTNARVVCGYYGCRRVWRPGRVWIAPRVIIREPRVIIRPGYNRHVSWCLSRYRSYNPATNLYVSYDGTYRVCRSPYR